jgi:hypothetical protein
VVKAVMEGTCAPHCELSVPLSVETGRGARTGTRRNNRLTPDSGDEPARKDFSYFDDASNLVAPALRSPEHRVREAAGARILLMSD